jgi:hypothetical protein
VSAVLEWLVFSFFIMHIYSLGVVQEVAVLLLKKQRICRRESF